MATAAPQSRFITIDRLRLHYLEWGAPDQPPLVAIHGAYQHAHCWDLVAAALSGHFRVLALDQRGHGDSDRAPDAAYTLDDFVGDLRGFLDALDLARVRLIGSSMGGRVAFTFAGAHPERVERLVIIGMGPERDEKGVARIRASNVAEPDSFPDEAAGWAYYTRRYPHSNPDYLRLDFQHAFRRERDGRLVRKFDPALRTFQSTYDPEASWAALRRVTTPTLIVRGEHSDVLSHEVAVRMQAAVPGSRLLELPGTGHLALAEQPAALSRALLEFLV